LKSESLYKIICETSKPPGKWEDGRCKTSDVPFEFKTSIINSGMLCEMLSCIVENGKCVCGIDVSPLNGETFASSYDLYWSPIHGWVLLMRGQKRDYDDSVTYGSVKVQRLGGRYRFLVAKLLEIGNDEYIWNYLGGGELSYFNTVRSDKYSSGSVYDNIDTLALDSKGIYFLMSKNYSRSTSSSRSSGNSYYNTYTKREYELIGCSFNDNKCKSANLEETIDSDSSTRSVYKTRNGRRFLSSRTSERKTESIYIKPFVKARSGFIPPEPILKYIYSIYYKWTYEGHPTWYSNSFGRGSYYACDVRRVNEYKRTNTVLGGFGWIGDELSGLPLSSALCYEAPRTIESLKERYVYVSSAVENWYLR